MTFRGGLDKDPTFEQGSFQNQLCVWVPRLQRHSTYVEVSLCLRKMLSIGEDVLSCLFFHHLRYAQSWIVYSKTHCFLLALPFLDKKASS